MSGHSWLSTRLCVAACMASLSSGCLSSATHNKIGRTNVVSRAEFDLQCPRQYLEFTVLQTNGDLVTSYGVAGCGKRAAYVRGPQDTFVLDRTPFPAQAQPQGSFGVLQREAAPRSAP